MTMSFPVEWRRVFKSLSIFMTFAVAVPIAIVECIRPWRRLAIITVSGGRFTDETPGGERTKTTA